MHLMLIFLLGLFAQQTLTQQQRGNLYTVGSNAPSTGFSNIGNVNRHSLNAITNTANGHHGGGGGGGGGGGYPGNLGGGGGGGGGYPGYLGGGGGGGGGYPGYLGGGGGGGGFQTGFGQLGSNTATAGSGGGFFNGGPGLGFGPKLGFGAVPGFGHLPIGGPGLAPFGGHGVGGRFKAVEPLKLTCKNVEIQPASSHYGSRLSGLAATIAPVRADSGLNNPFGAPFLFGHHGQGKRALSLDLSVRAEGANGPAKVVFTERGAVASGGCNKYSLGNILVGEGDNPFANLFGHGFLGGYSDEPDGVVTTLSVFPDRTTTVHKDRLDFDQIDSLAGRGLAVVSAVTRNSYGQSEMSDEILACCALAYDDQDRDLTDLNVAGYQNGGGHAAPLHAGPPPAPYNPINVPPHSHPNPVDPAPYHRPEEPYERPHDRSVAPRNPSAVRPHLPVPGPVVGPQDLPGPRTHRGRAPATYDDPRFD